MSTAVQQNETAAFAVVFSRAYSYIAKLCERQDEEFGAVYPCIEPEQSTPSGTSQQAEIAMNVSETILSDLLDLKNTTSSSSENPIVTEKRRNATKKVGAIVSNVVLALNMLVMGSMMLEVPVVKITKVKSSQKP